MKNFDLTAAIEQQQVAHTIWGMAQISVPAPANTNGVWRE